MPHERVPGKTSTRRYSLAEKEQAVRLVRKLRDELGTEHGTIGCVARQLGYGEESVRSWVRQADIDDGEKPGVTSEQAQRIKALERRTRSSAGRTRSCAGRRRISPRRSSTAHFGDGVVHRRQP